MRAGLRRRRVQRRTLGKAVRPSEERAHALRRRRPAPSRSRAGRCAVRPAADRTLVEKRALLTLDHARVGANLMAIALVEVDA